MLPPPRGRRPGFTLVELLSVIAILTIFIAISVKLVNTLTGNLSVGQINAALADVLNEARNVATTRNTYVWVGFASPADPGNTGLAVAAVESVTGQAGDLSAVPPVSLKAIMPVRTFQGVRLDKTLSIAAMNPNGVDVSGSSLPAFKVRDTTFTQVIQFDPQGGATCQAALSPWIDIKLRQNVGNRADAAALQIAGTTGAVVLFRP